MTSTDFHLAREESYLCRLTAQSKGSDPKQPPGGEPEFTFQEIQTITWTMDLFAFWVVMAKVCQDEISEANLAEAMRRLARAKWEGGDTGTEILNRIAEAAVIVFLTPRGPNGHLRKDPWIAHYIEPGMHRKTFQRKYKHHYTMLLGVLDRANDRGMRYVKQALRKG